VTLSAQVVAHRRAARLLASARQLRGATETAVEAIFPARSLDVLRQWRRARQRRKDAPTRAVPRTRGREIEIEQQVAEGAGS
jgi:hypothetical protein